MSVRVSRIATVLAVGLLALPFAFTGKSPARSHQGGSQAAVCSADTARVRQIALIFNSRDDGFDCLGLAIAEDAITAIHFESHTSSGDVADGQPPLRIHEFTIGQIETRHGAVLDGTPGHDAVILQGRFARPATRAELTIHFLYNGITNDYRQCAVTIGRSADHAWHLLNAFHQVVDRIFVRTWSLPLVGTAGIANLEGACTATVADWRSPARASP